MSSGGRESPPDPGGAGERSGRRRKAKQTLKGSGLPSIDSRLSDRATNPTETETRPSTPELVNLDATSAVPSAHDDDPLPFPLPSPRPLTRGTWRNLSIIFEGSESTNSLSNEEALPNKSASTSVVSRPNQYDHVANFKHIKDKSRYSLPNISSLVSKSSKPTDSTKTSVAEKIAYFEESLRNGKATSTSSPRLKSFLPVPQESRRRSLPSSLNPPSPSSPSSVSFPTRPSYSDESNLGTKLHIGFLWYLNVHGPGPPKWILCNASLYRTALLLTWQTSGTTRATVNLDLLNCLDVQSTPTVSDPSVASDVGAIAWSWDRERVSRSVDDIYPMHLQFDDGVERIATSTLVDRVTWVGMLLEFLPVNPSRDSVTTPRERDLSPLLDLISTTIIPLQGSQDTAPAAIENPSPSPFRPNNGHNRARSTGDVPKVPQISKETQRKPLIRRISSMSNIFSIDSSTSSETGYGYVTADRGSPLSTLPSRRRSVSLKSVTSFLSRRSSRMDDTSSDGSEPAAPVSPAPTKSRVLLHSRSGSQERELVVSDEADGNTLGRLFRKRDASAPARLKKPKPRLPALARLTIDPYWSFSDDQVPAKPKGTVLASPTTQDLGDSSRSPTYHSAVTSMPSTPQYHTASEGDPREAESSHLPSAEAHIQIPTSSASDSLFVTASNFTSSDAWMVHFTAATLPASPKAPPSRRRPDSGPSTPGTMSSSHAFGHLPNVDSTPLPALTASNTSSIISVAANVGSTHRTIVSTVEDSDLSACATLGDPTFQVDEPEASIVLVDELSSEMETQSFDHPPVPPPSIDNPPPTSLYPLSGAFSTVRTNSTLGVAATASARAGPPNTPNQTLPNEISTQIDATNSIQEVLLPTRFGLLRNGETEYEMTLVQSTSTGTPSVPREPQPLLPSKEPPRRRVVPKRVVPRLKPDSSLHSSICLPSGQPSVRSVTPDTPSSVEVSLTPVQASVYPSIVDTGASDPDVDQRTNGLEQDSFTCEQRLNNLLEFVERTRAVQTETSADFSEQLGRIENQLLELGRLIRERMAMARMETGDDNRATLETQERPTHANTLAHRHLDSRVPRNLTIISLSPPRSPFYDETTLTSVELHTSITHFDISNGVGAPTSLRIEPPTPRPAGDISSSLHLSRFPEVPHISPRRLLSVDDAACSVSNLELMDMIERLSESIDGLVTRQQVLNDALGGLQRTNIAAEPLSLSSGDKDENTTPRWTELVKSLENFTQRQRGSHRAHDNLHQFLDISSARTSPSNVEILPVIPTPIGTTSLAYARKILAPRRRSQSLLPTVQSDEGSSSSKESSPPLRARSVDNVVIMANEPTYAAQRNSVQLLDNDILGSLVTASLTPLHGTSIARTGSSRPKPHQPQVHRATPLETITDNLLPLRAEGDTGIDSGAAQVTRLLQESRTRQEAASTQQDEIVRYLGELNDWLSRDAIDRRAELRGLGDRLDGIQRTMMYGPAPAVSIAVPLRPTTFFTAMSEQSSEHGAWPTAQDNEAPIIPPLPLQPGKTPTAIPVKSAKKNPKGHKGTILHSAPSSSPPHDGEEGPTIDQDIPSSVALPSASRRSAGQRVTFATPSEELPAATHPQGGPNHASSIIRVSEHTVFSHPDARLFGISRGVDDGLADQQSPIKDWRQSRSRARKPLTRETSEIVVNSPGTRRQSESSARFQFPDRSTAYLPLNTSFEAGGLRQPVAAMLPDRQKESTPVTQCHAIIRDDTRSVPRTVRETTRLDFVEGRSSSRDCEGARSPTFPSQNHRRTSRNAHYRDDTSRRRSSRGPEFIVRRGDHNHERSTGHEGRHYKPRSTRSNSPGYRHVPYPRHSSVRNTNPPILSPLPLHRGKPLPPILIEPTVADLHQSQRHGPENPRHAVGEHSDGARLPHSPRILQRRIPAPVYRHQECQPDSRAHTTSQTDILFTVSPESRQRKSLVTTRDRTLEHPAEITGSTVIRTIVHPFSVHRIHEVVSHERSRPAVSASMDQPLAPKPQGARAKGSIQQQTAMIGPGYSGKEPSTPIEVEAPRMEILKNVGVAETQLVLTQTIGTHDTAGSTPTRVYQGESKRVKKSRKRAESRLSAILESSEPRLPSLPSFDIIAEADRETAMSDSDFSEQARDTIFLARQEERQRVLDENAQVQTLANEKLILDLQDPNLTEAYHKQREIGTSVFSRRPQAHHPGQPSLSSATNTVAIVLTKSRPGKEAPESLQARQAAGACGTPGLASYRSLGAIVSEDQNFGLFQPASRPLPSTSRMAESMRFDQRSRIDRLVQSLKDGRPPSVPDDPHSLELANERAKARRLEEEIQKTKDAIQAIKDERAAANEKRCLGTLTSISQMQGEMRGQIQSITEQLRLNRGNLGGRAEEVPTTTFEDDITEIVNRIHDEKSTEHTLKARGRSVAEQQSALAQDMDQLRQRNEAQRVLIEDMLGKTTKENRRHQEVLLEAFKRASAEQVKANVNEQLHEFTGVITQEVRTLLREVGDLRDHRRRLQHEIGCLLCFRSKMEPGGEFDASWNPARGPACTHLPPPGEDGAPGFAGSAPTAAPNAPNIPVALSSRQPPAGTPNASPVVPTVTSPPPAYAQPRPNNRGAQTRAPRVTNPPVVGTSQGNRESTASRPPPPRAARKSRLKRPE